MTKASSSEILNGTEPGPDYRRPSLVETIELITCPGCKRLRPKSVGCLDCQLANYSIQKSNSFHDESFPESDSDESIRESPVASAPRPSFEVMRYQEHYEESTTPCKFNQNGCLFAAHKKDIKRHEDSCGFEMIVCSCGAMLLRNEFSNHISTECITATIKSPTLRKKPSFTESFAKRTVSCEHCRIGCEFKGTYEEYEVHRTKCTYSPVANGLTMILNKLEQYHSQIEILRRDVERKQQQIFTLKRTSESLAKEKEKLHNSVSRMRQQLIQNTQWNEAFCRVVVPVDFALYNKNDWFYSERFDISCLTCKLCVYPKSESRYKESLSSVYLLCDKVMEEDFFIVVAKFKINDIVDSVAYFPSNNIYGWGGAFKNDKMIQMNGQAKLKIHVTIKVLSVALYQNEEETKKAYATLKECQSKDCDFALQRRICTYCVTNDKTKEQKMFQCSTCGDVEICLVCANSCHKGHTLKDKGVITSYCDCAKKSKCQKLDYFKLLK